MTEQDNRPPFPAEFAASEAPSADQLAAASPAIKVIEGAIKAHHVVEVTYTPLDGVAEHLEIEPYGFRINPAGHLVIWAWDTQGDHWGTLLADRVSESIDSGRSFKPRSDW